MDSKAAARSKRQLTQKRSSSHSKRGAKRGGKRGGAKPTYTNSRHNKKYHGQRGAAIAKKMGFSNADRYAEDELQQQLQQQENDATAVNITATIPSNRNFAALVKANSIQSDESSFFYMQNEEEWIEEFKEEELNVDLEKFSKQIEQLPIASRLLLSTSVLPAHLVPQLYKPNTDAENGDVILPNDSSNAIISSIESTQQTNKDKPSSDAIPNSDEQGDDSDDDALLDELLSTTPTSTSTTSTQSPSGNNSKSTTNASSEIIKENNKVNEDSDVDELDSWLDSVLE